MLDIPSISAVVAAVGVRVGVSLAYLEVRTLVKLRQTDLVMRLYSTFGSKEFQEQCSKVLNVKKEYYVEVKAFFEAIGVLLHKKLIDIELVDDLFSSAIKLFWEKLKPIVEDQRRQFKRPQISEWFEYLYNEMQKREQRLQQTQQ